ncbi:MAG: formylglycine-generating enzyme family protein [Planctomycetaceae bacterium]|nr:formylglycine-generating enzyme family protein [Planctomycetaceae bacterium]
MTCVALMLCVFAFADEPGTARGNESKVLRNSVDIVLRPVSAGTFTMGAPSAESGKRTDERPRQVTITRPFLISQTEVTQQQWTVVMKTAPWRGKRSVKLGPDRPAAYVNWHQAVAFCRKLSRLENRVYRLPTEAEWECACRAGTQTAYSFGVDADELPRHAFCEANTMAVGAVYAHPVARKLPNAFGLHDMHGNQWEWCADWYTPHPAETVDPTGPALGRQRVIRGGSWHCSADLCRSATRFYRDPTMATSDVGFRVLREHPPAGSCD